MIGVGLTAFEKPRQRRDYDEMAVEATTKALLDSGLNYGASTHQSRSLTAADDIDAAFTGYCASSCILTCR